MVGSNTTLTSSEWIKKNMLGVYSEQLGRALTEPEIRVQRSTERLPVPDWYRKYKKPSVKFLKNDTPIECRPPTWRSMKGKMRSPRKTASKPHSPEKAQTTLSKQSPRKSLNSNYRIGRRTNNNVKANNGRASITISPTTSDSDSAANHTISPRLRRLLNTSHTFPRVQPSRKIQNINIVLPPSFTPKPARAQREGGEQEGDEQEGGEQGGDEAEPPDNWANNSSIISSTLRTQYTLTKSIEVKEPGPNDTHYSDAQSSYTSFLFAEVKPSGVTSTVHMFAGMDSSGDEGVEGVAAAAASSSSSSHSRFFSTPNKSSQLERIVRSSRREKRADSLIREIICELDRSLVLGNAAAAAAATRPSHGDDQPSERCQFVRSMVRALESENASSPDDNYSSDSDLAKSTSISSLRSDDDLPSSDDRQPEQDSSPLTSNDHQHEHDEHDEHDEEVYWIPSQIRQLPRTSSRVSTMSRGSSRSGFQCASGQCSPGLSPIKDDRPVSAASCRSHKISRQLFRIDESHNLAADSGCYSDRSRSAAISSRAAGAYSSPSPIPADFDDFTTDVLTNFFGSAHPNNPISSSGLRYI